jgi:hypothetical protein
MQTAKKMPHKQQYMCWAGSNHSEVENEQTRKPESRNVTRENLKTVTTDTVGLTTEDHGKTEKQAISSLRVTAHSESHTYRPAMQSSVPPAAPHWQPGSGARLGRGWGAAGAKLERNEGSLSPPCSVVGYTRPRCHGPRPPQDPGLSRCSPC